MYSVGVLTTLFAFFIACANLFCAVGYGSASVFILQGVLMTACCKYLPHSARIK